MALSDVKITSDLIDRPTLAMRYTALGLAESVEYTRVVICENLTVAALGVARDAVVVALQAIQALYPVGAGDANIPLARARSYSLRDSPSGDICIWGVGFVYEAAAWENTIWHVQSSSQGEVVDTDVQYDPNSPGALIPISVDNYTQEWKQLTDDTPTDANGNVVECQPVEYGSVAVSKSVKTVTYTRQEYSESAAVAFDKMSLAYDQHLNSVTFNGLTSGPVVQNLGWAPGTVLCQSIVCEYDPFENRNLLTIVLAYKPEGWQPWIRYVDPTTGNVPANIWRAGTDSKGSYSANGTVRTTAFDTADHNQLLLSLGGSPSQPFGGGGALPTGS